MTAPPWGHKPPAVPDHSTYWLEPPPTLSPRCRYWLRRLDDGTWHANKYLRREGYWGGAAMAGVYIWEWLHVLRPAIRADYERRFREESAG